MSETGHTTTAHGGGHDAAGEELRSRAHKIIDHLPLCELKAAVIALEELEVTVQVRHEWTDRHAEA